MAYYKLQTLHNLYKMQNKIAIISILVFFMFSCKKQERVIVTKKIEIGAVENINAISFLNDSIGFMCGGEKYTSTLLLKTTDAGNTWSNVVLQASSQRKAMYGIATNKKDAILCAGYGGAMQVSTDSGSSFHYVQHPAWLELKGVCYRTQDSVVLCGGLNFRQGNITMLDKNGNTTFSNIDTTNFECSSVYFTSPSVGYIAGYGVLLKTIDGGKTWQATNAKNDFFASVCFANNIGIAVGKEGSILKSIDYGTTWEPIKKTNIPFKKNVRLNKVVALHTNHYVCVGDNGIVCESTDAGEHWELIKEFTQEDIKDIVQIKNTHCIVVGTKGMVYDCLL